MDSVVLSSFVDELGKIAENIAAQGTKSLVSKIAPRMLPVKPKAPTLSAATKGTNYTVVNTQPPPAAIGTASGTKSLPPPPVRT